MGATRIMVIRHAAKPDTYPPWGPKAPELSTPGFLFAADPADKSSDGAHQGPDDEPSQRPYQTLTAAAAKLGLTIDTSYRKSKFKDMGDAALSCAGASSSPGSIRTSPTWPSTSSNISGHPPAGFGCRPGGRRSLRPRVGFRPTARERLDHRVHPGSTAAACGRSERRAAELLTPRDDHSRGGHQSRSRI